ncbi:MAG: adenosylcobinamide-GDP ribazoletransferase [Ardenticatenia bacterium]|nr:adenosylcobinamide-GDP ribazoletransferase [Ardenticatenia bacterium]
MFRVIRLAFSFLTVLPLSVSRVEDRELGATVGWFPLVGLTVGSVLVVAAWISVPRVGADVAGALVVGVWVVLTGALHVDGFLDVCDGLFGGHTPQERLRIMRDERVGAFAVAGGALLFLAKYSAMATLLAAPWPVSAGLVLSAPVLGRWAMSLATVSFPYARPQGLGQAMNTHAGRREAVLAGTLALGVVGLVLRSTGVALWAGATLLTWLAGRWALRRVPGFTGDMYGALCESTEAAVLIVGVALMA